MELPPLIARFAAVVAEHSAWLVTGSVLSMLIGAVLVPILILRMPADYFHPRRRHTLAGRGRHPFVRLALAGAKNLIGATFLLAGLALLFLPGQGVLTLLAGIAIMNYPGKFAFERWLVRRARVLPALNWLRTRYGRPPLQPPDGDP